MHATSSARLSIFALSTLAALMSQELARTNTAPNSTTSKSAAKAQPNESATGLLPVPSQPDILLGQEFAGAQGEGQLSVSQDAFASFAGASGFANPDQAVERLAAILRSDEIPGPPVMADVPPSLMANGRSIDDIVSEALAPVTQFANYTSPTPTPVPPAQPAKPKAPEPAGPPADIQGHPAQGAIVALIDQGLVRGFSDGTFRPDATITDEHFQGMMRRAFPNETIERPSNVLTRADAVQYAYDRLHPPESPAPSQPGNFTPLLASASDTNPPAAQSADQSLSEGERLEAEAARSVLQVSDRYLAPFNPGTSKTPETPTPAPATSFTSGPSTPAIASRNTLSRPVTEDPAYTLGPGDRLRVEVFNVPEYSKDYQVLVNGTINLHMIGSVRLSGLTLQQAEEEISTRYASLVRRSIINLSLLSPRPLNVAIGGEILRPGSYTIPVAEGAKFPTVSRLLQQAGGALQTADIQQVIVRRPSRSGQMQLLPVNLWAFVQTGDSSQDIGLRDGDEVYIPPTNAIDPTNAARKAALNFSADANQPMNVAVTGEVNRPGPYVVKGLGGTGAGALPTVTQALQEAGGISGLADLRKVQVKRTTRSGNTQTIELNLWDGLKNGDMSQDLVLQQGDTIFIPTATALNPQDAYTLGNFSFARKEIEVSVVGEVISPGTRKLAPNTTMNQALLSSGGFNRDAYKKSIQLVRLNPNGTIEQREIKIDLSRGIDEQLNPAMRQGDILVVKKSGTAKFSDALDRFLGPVGRILPFRGLLGI